MATFNTVGRAVSAQVAAGATDIINFDPASNPAFADVVNRGTGTLWVRPDNGTVTAGGGNCVPVLPNQTVRFALPYGRTIRLLCPAANDYTVVGITAQGAVI